MAKTAWINRNERKRATVKKYAAQPEKQFPPPVFAAQHLGGQKVRPPLGPRQWYPRKIGSHCRACCAERILRRLRILGCESAHHSARCTFGRRQSARPFRQTRSRTPRCLPFGDAIRYNAGEPRARLDW